MRKIVATTAAWLSILCLQAAAQIAPFGQLPQLVGEELAHQAGIGVDGDQHMVKHRKAKRAGVDVFERRLRRSKIGLHIVWRWIFTGRLGGQALESTRKGPARQRRARRARLSPRC